jgi:hypothetical protein
MLGDGKGNFNPSRQLSFVKEPCQPTLYLPVALHLKSNEAVDGVTPDSQKPGEHGATQTTTFGSNAGRIGTK